jgi:hypothetical protein
MDIKGSYNKYEKVDGLVRQNNSNIGEQGERMISQNASNKGEPEHRRMSRPTSIHTHQHM